MSGVQRQQQQQTALVPGMFSSGVGIREKLRANLNVSAAGGSRKCESENAVANGRRGPLIVKPLADLRSFPGRERIAVTCHRTDKYLRSSNEGFSSSPPKLPVPVVSPLPARRSIKPLVTKENYSLQQSVQKASLSPKPAASSKPSNPGVPSFCKGLRRPTSLISLLPTSTCHSPRSRPPSPSSNVCGLRSPSPGSSLDPALLEVLRLRVRKVRAVRLYLLQRVGPHSFLVAADPPEHKFKVTIGPQSCTCGRGAYCIHVLFVMLRVLQVRESDPKIFSKTLKNFEVEELTQQYLWRRRQQQAGSAPLESGLLASRGSQRHRLPPSRGFHNSSHSRPSKLTASRSESSLQEALKEKEKRQALCGGDDESRALCPICLLDMVEGEALVSCEKGCRNKFHHHCIAIWAEECRRQNENILCPLCRALWASPPGNTNSFLHNSRNELKVIKPNPAKDSPLVPSQNLSGVFQIPSPVKYYSSHSTSSIIQSCKSSSPKKSSTARDSLKAQDTQAWCQVFGRDFVSWILSPHWSSREKGLKWLCREVSSILSLSQEVSGGRVSPNLNHLLATTADCHMVVEVCCRVVAFMVTDPVYKVFIAALRVWRTVLSHSLCKTDADFIRLIELTKPIIKAVLLKCADGSRRTSQLSIATLVEIARGQTGAFAVGSQTLEQNLELGGPSQSVDYILRCAMEEATEECLDASSQKGSPNWQWLLGRLALAERLMEEFPQEFYLLYVPTLPSVGGSLGTKAQTCYKILNYDRLLSLLEFTKNALEHPHSTVNKMAHRIFIMASRFSTHIPPVFSQVLDIVSTLDSSVQRSLSRKLEAILEDLKSPESWSRHGQNSNQPLHKSKRAESESQQERNLVQEKLVAVEETSQRILGRLLPSRLKLTGFGKGSEKRRPSYLPLRKSNSALLEATSKCAKSSQTTLGHSELCLEYLTGATDSVLSSPDVEVTDDLIDLSPSLTSCESPMSFGTEISTPLSPTAYLLPWNASVANNSEPPSSPSQEESWGEAGAEFCPIIPGLRDTSDEDMVISLQPDLSPDTGQLEPSERGPGSYMESVHWLRGPLLGTGAFSTCYQARDARTGSLMAVKQVSFYRNEEAEQQKVMEAIREEIVMMGKLRHPNILRILGATQQGGHYNVFVEWMAGGSVAGLLDRYGAFSEDVLLGYTWQVLHGLTYLHANHILHRDLKGANLLLDSSGHHLRIADFGAAARLASQATVAGEFQGQLLGTIAFMAPEVLRGEDYGRSCDVWSVGCVLIEMATTKPPWNASDISNHLALIFKIACSNAPPAVPEHLRAEVQDFALQCLQVNSEDRPTAKQLLQHPVFKRITPAVTDNGYRVQSNLQLQQHQLQKKAFDRTSFKNQVPGRLTAVAY